MLPEPSQSRNGAICNHMFRRNGYRPDGKIGWAEARGERDPKSSLPKKICIANSNFKWENKVNGSLQFLAGVNPLSS